ncbi:MAG: hypothetical protein KBD83_06225, partial [Gammaproteobacteria bacterium]|nr:hypothetical protein [Gammaproteobacteria bacterium]
MQTLILHGTHLHFQDLFTAKGLQQLDQHFLHHLQQADTGLYHHLIEYRQKTLTLTIIQTSDMLIALSIHIERFIAKLFDIETEVSISQENTQQKNPIAEFRKHFLLIKVKKLLHAPAEMAPFAILHQQLLQALNLHKIQIGDLELEVATLGLLYLK